MTQPRTSYRHPSGAFAVLWIPLGLALAFLLTICSVNPLLSLAVVGVFVAVQVVANRCVGPWLDAKRPGSGFLQATGRSLVIAIGIAMVSWPVLVVLVPESTNCM